MGAQPVRGDALDAGGLEEAVRGAQPEVVISQLTDLPKRFSPRALERSYAGNDRVRRDGTLNLLRAGQRAGARRIIAQSIAFWYRPEPRQLATEEEALWLEAPAPLNNSIRALTDMETGVLGAEGIEGVVLRYAAFYGPGTWYAGDGDIAAQVRRRRFPIVGAGSGVQSYVHIDDAVAATELALSAGDGPYNIVDDEPLAQHEWLPLYASALGAKPPRRVPVWLARRVAGAGAVDYLTRMRGASNERARRELGFRPTHPTVREGFAADLRSGA